MPTKMSKPTEIQVNISLPEKGFPKTLYFNRVRVDSDAGFCFVQFGLVVASDLIDSYSCVFTDESLKHNRDTLIQYMPKLGSGDGAPSWKGVTASRNTDVADIFAMSFRGNMAETALYIFSLTGATRAITTQPTNPVLSAEPLVLLRSTPILQKQLIAELYQNE
jgi:hypothetical protein